MLDATFKGLWLEALRSGKFKQAQGKLRSRNGARCCLGVACDVLGVDLTWKKEPGIEGGYYPEGAFEEGADEFYLPRELREQIGLSYTQGMTLAQMNDGIGDDDDGNPVAKHSFAQIADYIEANL